MSTGFEITRRMPLNEVLVISGMMVLKIAVFFCTKSRRVSPGFWLTPAVIMTMLASARSS